MTLINTHIRTSRCFEVVGYLIFINTLLLVARGWTITTSKLSRKSENAFFTALLVCIYVGLFFSDTLRDRADRCVYVYVFVRLALPLCLCVSRSPAPFSSPPSVSLRVFCF